MKSQVAALSAGVLLLGASPALAQTKPPMSAEEARALKDDIAALRAEIAAMERRLEESGLAAETAAVATAPAAPAAPAPAAAPVQTASVSDTTITWKGAPEIASGDRSFKVKGRIQADAAYVDAPGGLDDPGLGFGNEIRRIRLGGEGRLGGGVGYKLELELSDNVVELVDTVITYETKNWLLSVGNHNQFQALDEMTGDSSGSMMERAAFTDAFNFERRLGVSAQYRGIKDWLFQGGVFTDDIEALSNSSDGPEGGDENNSVGVDGRVVYAPKLGDTQLHLGASAHYRDLNRLSDSSTRYRQRPFVHVSNSRLIGTPSLAVDDETHYGVEFAAIRGPWHVATEGHWLDASQVNGPTANFGGGYAEVGYFLTKGDSRAYKNGIFDRTKPVSPIDRGGLGYVQLNFRYDYLNLNDGSIRGGEQNGYIASLIWGPLDYLRLNLNYAYLDYDGATPLDDGRRNYGVHVTGARIEVDF
ncbi:porin [Phenylobacterium koreense]|uniref:Phosphate-selective porin OprO/OprP n=2 Tax=Phenylobacterium TaxID=20 RepID=A0ABV2EJ88_9CAUL